MQETHNSEKTEKIYKTEWGGEWFNSHGTSQAKGVSILITKRLGNNVKCLSIQRDSEGRFLMIKLLIENKIWLLSNIYGENNDCPQYYEQIAHMLNEQEADCIVLGGDFNLVMDAQIDSKFRKESHVKAKEILHTIIDELELVDIWRVRNPDTFRFTWKKN